MNPTLLEQVAAAHRDDLLRDAAERRRAKLVPRPLRPAARERTITIGRIQIAFRVG